MTLKGNHDLKLAKVIAAIPIDTVSIITRLIAPLSPVSADGKADCGEIGQSGTTEERLKCTGTRAAVPAESVAVIAGFQSDGSERVSANGSAELCGWN